MLKNKTGTVEKSRSGNHSLMTSKNRFVAVGRKNMVHGRVSDSPTKHSFYRIPSKTSGKAICDRVVAPRPNNRQMRRYRRRPQICPGRHWSLAPGLSPMLSDLAQGKRGNLIKKLLECHDFFCRRVRSLRFNEPIGSTGFSSFQIALSNNFAIVNVYAVLTQLPINSVPYALCAGSVFRGAMWG